LRLKTGATFNDRAGGKDKRNADRRHVEDYHIFTCFVNYFVRYHSNEWLNHRKTRRYLVETHVEKASHQGLKSLCEN
jgi:hypothetical protein